MRILHVGKYYHPFKGGIENFMGDLLPTLLDSHEIVCLVHNHNRSFRNTQESVKGVSVIKSAVWFRLLFTPISPLFGLQLRQQLNRFKPDVIHVHMPNVSAFWLLLPGFRPKVPIIVHWHADVLGATRHFGLSMAYKLYRPLEQRLLFAAKKIIATSPAYAASSDPLSIWRDKVEVIPLGLNDLSEDTVMLNKQANRDRDHFTLLCIGRLTFYKGHEYLIRAMEGLDRVKLTIVGEGEELKQLRSLVDQLGLQTVVRITGFVESAELMTMIANSDCICLPSLERTEAFGVVLLEAMRASKPVVVSDVPGSGMSWVVDNEITGLLVQCKDIVGLQSAIKYLQHSPDVRTRMGVAGRQKFDSDFTIARVAKQIKFLYLTVAETSG